MIWKALSLSLTLALALFLSLAVVIVVLIVKTLLSWDSLHAVTNQGNFKSQWPIGQRIGREKQGERRLRSRHKDATTTSSGGRASDLGYSGLLIQIPTEFNKKGRGRRAGADMRKRTLRFECEGWTNGLTKSTTKTVDVQLNLSLRFRKSFRLFINTLHIHHLRASHSKRFDFLLVPLT